MEVKGMISEVERAGLLRRLKHHPEIEARMIRLLDLVENAGGDLKRADDAEQRAIDELRAMGQELLGAWGQRLANEEARAVSRGEPVVHQVKKTALAQHLRRNRGR